MMINKGTLSKNKLSIFIVEDHPVFRMGIKELINQEPDLYICGEAEDTSNAWRLIQELKPDMVILDISLKESNGIDLIKDIDKHYKDLPILVLSMHDESLYAERSLSAGAEGYIMKHETSESIIKAIRSILKGNIYVSEKVVGNILSKYTNKPNTIDESPVSNLTDRELEVFQLIGRGFPSSDIAKQLNLSIKTIGTYRERIKEKLCLKNAAELVRYAVQWVERSR